MKLIDSSCLICLFKEINRPFILSFWKKRGYDIVITNEVYSEIKKNPLTDKLIEDEIKNGNLSIKDLISKEELEEFRKRHPQLGIGECSIIIFAKKLNLSKQRYYAVIDDRKAYSIAKTYDVKLTGTYGLLKTLKEKGEIETKIFDDCKEKMAKSNFRINFDKIK